jgi:hypothetical protein
LVSAADVAPLNSLSQNHGKMPTPSFHKLGLPADGEKSQIVSFPRSGLSQKVPMKKFIQKVDEIGLNSRRIESHVPETFQVRVHFTTIARTFKFRVRQALYFVDVGIRKHHLGQLERSGSSTCFEPLKANLRFRPTPDNNSDCSAS